VARAQGRPSVSLTGIKVRARVRLTWFAHGGALFRLSVAVNGRAPHVLLASTSRTSTVYPLKPGRHYIFSIATLDDAGLERASSTFSVRG